MDESHLQSDSEEIPEFVGPYKIEGPLGVGGMGKVYSARHRVLNIPVAVKVFFRDVTEKPASAKRFIQEARLAASIEHINLVRVMECGNDQDDHPYYVMEKMSSSVFLEIKKNGPCSEREAIDIGESVARGMSVAHSHGIIHRDIKPDNIMVSVDGLYKVGDLGLAKLQNIENTSPGLTMTKTGLGTPHFMSPEQALDAANADGRADIFSLGASLYFMVTGKKPFDNEGVQAIINENFEKGAPDAGDLVEDLSAGFCQLIKKCMAYKAEDRYQTMEEVHQGLVDLRHRFHDSVRPIHYDTCFDLAGTKKEEIERLMAEHKQAVTSQEEGFKVNKLYLAGVIILIVILLVLLKNIAF
ncbi:serine/threonine-protein kinase [Lentisphaera marina]|uniref:serine/threonine protein kinase n=1 Tax=Lentisphaera marina TaxID=1111041 RepID=UPI002366ADCA|nr:serine/threonine-protein kinase [Lentisphaera marina]MDD7987522.1 serine/threonine-protein kinase [Lentisphaera marina]